MRSQLMLVWDAVMLWRTIILHGRTLQWLEDIAEETGVLPKS